MDETMVNELKKSALELAEDVTEDTIKHVFDFAQNALLKNDNAMLKAIVSSLATVKDYLLSLADKIDGVAGNLEIKG